MSQAMSDDLARELRERIEWWDAWERSNKGDESKAGKIQLWHAIRADLMVCLSHPQPPLERTEQETIDKIIRDVSELPDRTSPEDKPEMMLVTVEELWDILTKHLDVGTVRDPGTGLPEDVSELVKAVRYSAKYLGQHRGLDEHARNTKDAADTIERLAKSLAASERIVKAAQVWVETQRGMGFIGAQGHALMDAIDAAARQRSAKETQT